MNPGDIYYNNSLIVCVMRNNELFAYNKNLGTAHYETKKMQDFKDALYQYELPDNKHMINTLKKEIIERCFDSLNKTDIY